MIVDDLPDAFERLTAGVDVARSPLSAWRAFVALAREPIDGVPRDAPLDSVAFEVAHGWSGPRSEPIQAVMSRAVMEEDDEGNYQGTMVFACHYEFAPTDQALRAGTCRFDGATAWAPPEPGASSFEDFVAAVERDLTFTLLLSTQVPTLFALTFGPS